MSESLQESLLSNSLSMYEIDSPMGRGAGSFVYKVKHRKTKKFAALKVIKKNGDKSQKIKERILNEIEVHSTLEHENIVSLIAHFEDKDNYYLLMELCEGGELYNLVKKKGRLSESEVKNFGLQFAKGLKYLHSNRVLHRDLKLSNLLLTEQNVLKICDFGLAVKLTDLQSERETICGTPNYISPEIINKESYGTKADTWAFGCILYAMAMGNPPFEGNSVKETLTKVQSGSFILPKDISTDLQDLLKKLICWDPKTRYDIDDILAHPFFQENPAPVLIKAASAPLDRICMIQDSSISFGNPDSIPQDTETPDLLSTRQESATNHNLSTNCYNSDPMKQNHKPKSSSTALSTLLKSSYVTNGKLKSSQFSLVLTNQDSENKENEGVDTFVGESHASMFSKRRQELKTNHRIASKSIAGLTGSVEIKNGNLKGSKGPLEELSLKFSTRSDPNDFPDAQPLRMIDLNVQKTSRSNAPSLALDVASSIGGDDEHLPKQYTNRNVIPFNTYGLKANKFKIKGGSLEITDGGWVCMDLVNSKRKIGISPDGVKIQIEKFTPFRIEKTYNLSTLPTKYLKFYTYASQVCETMRNRVANRIRIEDSDGKFYLIKNKPYNTFEAKFVSGETVTHTLSSKTMRIQMIDGRIYEINVLEDASYLGEHLSFVVKKSLEKMNLCIEKGSTA